MTRFLLIFTAVLTMLFSVEMLTSVQQHIIQPFTASLADMSAWLMARFDANVLAYGNIIQHRQTLFAVSIEPGCNGVEAIIMLIAALVAFPAPWLARIKGILAGFLVIQCLNILRIISLFYLGQWHTELFEWAHLYIWPVMIMVDVLIVFLIWISRLPDAQPVGQESTCT